jgi:hypothetical protein
MCTKKIGLEILLVAFRVRLAKSQIKRIPWASRACVAKSQQIEFFASSVLIEA